MNPLQDIYWSSLLPYVVLAGGGLLVLLVDAFVRTLRKDHLTALNALVFFATGATLLTVEPHTGPIMGGMLTIQAYTRYFDLMFLGVGLITTILASAVYSRDGEFQPEFYPLVIFAVLGMMVLVAASDLLALFLGLETMSLAVTVLVAGRRDQRRGGEAALKYLLLGGFASAFLLMGMAFLYGYAGGTSYSALAEARILGERPELLYTAGVGLLLIGFAFKVALVPFHMWAPDVYDGAPAHITGFMATAVKAAAFAALVRFILVALPGAAGAWFGLLAALTVVTMTAGNLLALAQSSIKRMLAYSSIAHAGYLMLGVLTILAPGRGSGGSAPAEGAPIIAAAGGGLLFYLLGITLMNLAAFAIISQLGRSGAQEVFRVDHLRGLAVRQPVAAAILAVVMFSLAGFPGTVGFMAKFYVFEAVVRAGLLPLVIWGVVNAVLSVTYYLRVVMVMYMRETETETEPFDGRNWETVMIAGCLALLIILLGILPQTAHRIATSAFATVLG